MIYIDSILFVIDHDIDSISSMKITMKKILLKKWYLVQKVRNTFITSISYSKASFNFFQAALIIEFLPDNIALLRKKLH